MRIIPLTKGKFAIIDDEDYNLISIYKWSVTGKQERYARTAINVGKYKERGILMHRMILGLDHTDKRQVDHINGNGLDNRKYNLRLCSNMENTRNAKRRGGLSSYKGVFWHKAAGKWMSQIKVDYKSIYLGLYVTEEDAARAYDAAASKHFGEFARLNFP